MNRVGSLSVGAALAALVVFAVRFWLPEVYEAMGDLEKQAITVLVVGGSQRVWSLFV